MSKFRSRVELFAALTCGFVALACGPSVPAKAPEQEASARVVSLAARWESTCAVDAGGHVSCWGHDCHGAPPDGLFNFVCSYPKQVPGLERIVQISMGALGEADCALDRDGAVFCGRSRWGFARIAVPKARAVATTGDFMCALLVDGRVSCWSASPALPGKEARIQSAKTPQVLAGLSDVISLAARRDRIAVVDRQGNAYELRGAQVVDQPVPAYSIGPVRALIVSEYHRYFDVNVDLDANLFPRSVSATRKREGGYACAVRADGTLRCWGGDNAFGQLGVPCGETPCRTSFAEMGDVAIEGAPGVKALALGLLHTCALTQDGRAFCWGNNASGQLGQKTARGSSARPVRVESDALYTQIVAANNHTCALTEDGEVHCWGANADGQLGRGARTPAMSSTPWPVAF